MFHIGRESARRALPPQRIQPTPLRRDHQPRRRIVGDTLVTPNLGCAAEGVLDDIFREREVVETKYARECGDQSRRLLPEQLVEIAHYMSIFITGRTSTCPPRSRIGQPFASSAACATSLALIRVKPPMTSFASANGPSVMLRPPLWTILPLRSNGWPRSMIAPFSARTFIHSPR